MLLRVARLAVGAVELLAPERVVSPFVGRKPDESELIWCQLLGARHIVQGLYPRFLPAGRFATGPTLDLLHALSLVPVVRSQRHRRPALANTAEALTFAAFAAGSR